MQLPPPGKTRRQSNSTTTRQTVRAIDKVAAASQNQNSVKYFQGESWKEITDFVLSNFSYQPDPAGRQKIQTPDALMRSKTGNCVDFTTFLSAIAKAKGARHFYRLSDAYNPGLTHIYPIIEGKPLDMVAGITEGMKPGQQKSYTQKKDLMPSLDIVNGPNEVNAVISSLNNHHNQCRAIYNQLGGSVRAAMRVARGFSFTESEKTNLLDTFRNKCNEITKCGLLPPSASQQRANCTQYVNKNAGDINSSSSGLTPFAPGGSGWPGPSFGGGTGGGNTPPPQTAGFGAGIESILPYAIIGLGAIILMRNA